MNTRRKGYFGIGVEGMRMSLNFGTMARTAQIFGANFVFLIGSRFRSNKTNTLKSHRHVPVYEYESFWDFKKHLPIHCKLIGVELMEEAVELSTYSHPKRACYLLGAEDLGISSEIAEQCDQIVKIPGEFSLNVSVAGSIVLYDRITKQNSQ